MLSKVEQLLTETNRLLARSNEDLARIRETSARDGLDLSSIRREMGVMLRLLQDQEVQQALRENRLPSQHAMKSSLPQPSPTMSPGEVKLVPEPSASPEKTTRQWTCQMSADKTDQRFLLSREMANQVKTYLDSRLWFNQVRPEYLQEEAKALIQFASAAEMSKET